MVPVGDLDAIFIFSPHNHRLCGEHCVDFLVLVAYSNRIASQRLIDAYTAYLPIATESVFNLTEVPVVTPPILGQKIQLNIRGVIGFQTLCSAF